MSTEPPPAPPKEGPKFPVDTSPGWTRARAIFVSVSALAVVVVGVAFRQVLLPFILGGIIAYVLTPLVAWGESKLRLPRSVSIVSVYLVVLGTVSLSGVLMAPRIAEETRNFVSEAPKVAHRLATKHGHRVETLLHTQKEEEASAERVGPRPAFVIEAKGNGYEVHLERGVDVVQEGEGHWRLQPKDEVQLGDLKATELVDEAVERFVEYAQINAIEFLKLGQTIVTSFSRAVLLTFMTLMVAGYLMHTRESVLMFFRSLAPKRHRPSVSLLVTRIDRGLSGVVRGQLVICVVNGLLSAAGFAFFGLKYWPVLALLAAVMSIIPIFGSILSTVPAVLIGLTQDIWTAFWVLIWILGIHQVEANFLNPKIIGVSAKIHPVLVVFALLAGEHYYGLWGALLAVPVLSLSQSVFNHFRFSLDDEEPDSISAEAILDRR